MPLEKKKNHLAHETLTSSLSPVFISVVYLEENGTDVFKVNK